MDIRWLRDKLGLSQYELGRKLGVRPETVSRWERGKQKPSRAVLGKIKRLIRDAGLKMD